MREIERILKKYLKNYENSECAAIVAALPGYNKQTLKSQMRDRLLIVKLCSAWCCLIGSTKCNFSSKIFIKKSLGTIRILTVVRIN